VGIKWHAVSVRNLKQFKVALRRHLRACSFQNVDEYLMVRNDSYNVYEILMALIFYSILYLSLANFFLWCYHEGKIYEKYSANISVSKEQISSLMYYNCRHTDIFISHMVFILTKCTPMNQFHHIHRTLQYANMTIQWNYSLKGM
jgi:hypothetical protein